jgi:hypothetical protein
MSAFQNPITAVWAAALILMGQSTQALSDWQFLAEPYLMATNIEGDAEIGRIDDASVDVDFGTILENLNTAFLFHGEAIHSSNWGVVMDYGMMDLEADKKSSRGGVVDASVRQAVGELAVIRRFGDERGSLDLFLGLRSWDNKIRVKLDPAADFLDRRQITKEIDWLDFYIGGRMTAPFADNWKAVGYADIGAGDSDLTYALKGGIEYSFNDTWGVTVLYKATWVDYTQGKRGTPGRFVYDTVTHGPLVGVQIKF